MGDNKYPSIKESIGKLISMMALQALILVVTITISNITGETFIAAFLGGTVLGVVTFAMLK